MARTFTPTTQTFLQRSSAPATAGPLTIACWFRPLATPSANSGTLVSIEHAANAQAFLLRHEVTTGKLVAMGGSNGAGFAQSATPAAIPVGVWNHCAGVWSASAGNSWSFLNGVASTPSTFNYGTIAPNQTQVGRLWEGFLQYADGDIAEVAIWGATLNDAELAALARGVSPVLIRPASLLQYNPLDGNQSTEPDLWRNAYTLGVNNSPAKAPHPPIFRPAPPGIVGITSTAAALAASSSLAFSAAGALTAPVLFRAAAGVRLATVANLTTAPAALAAAASVAISTAAALTVTPRLAGATGFRIGSIANFFPPMEGAAALHFATAAALDPSPRLTTANITLGGADVHRRVRKAGLTIRDILNDAPNTCALVMDGEPAPLVGLPLRITLNDGAVVLFAGPLQSVEKTYEAGRPINVAWPARAIDDTARANERRPFGTWTDVSASTIAAELVATFAPDFGTAIEPGLPVVSITFDGSETMIAGLARLATLIGGYTKVEDGTVYLFIEDTAHPPDPVDIDHPPLNDPPIRKTEDSSQLRTRVYGKGYGESVPADIGAGETILPMIDAAQFTASGGKAIVGTTADGAQWQVIAYTSVLRSEGGTLVGPGAAPSNPPLLALAVGAGVTIGFHAVAVVFVTASGKSLAGPRVVLYVGYLWPPETAPAAHAAITGTGPDQGSHDYVVTFLGLSGETSPSPVSNAITTSAAVGQIAAPTTGPNVGTFVYEPGAIANFADYYYRATFLNATGETEGGAIQAGPYLQPPSAPTAPGPGPSGSAGGLTPSSLYRYFLTYETTNGYETALGSAADINLGPSTTAVEIVYGLGWTFDRRLTKVHIYRTKAGATAPHPTGFGGYRVATITHAPGTSGTLSYLDTLADASINTSTAYYIAGQGSPSGPRGPDPGSKIQLYNVPTGPAGVTARKIYRRGTPSSDYKLIATINDNITTSYLDNTETGGALVPTSNTTGTAVQRIPLTDIPLGPGGTTSRRLYRRFNGAGTFKLVTTLANNTAQSYTDSAPNAALGAAPPSENTALGNQIAVSAIPKGPAGVTARELYMTLAQDPTGVLRLALTVPDNTTDTATITIADAALAAAAAAPSSDTSGLTQPTGQVNAGSTVLPVASAAPFRSAGGWVRAGQQTIRYAGISGQTLTGVPEIGPGAIHTTIIYGQQALPAPLLLGVTGILRPLARGSAVHIWVQRDDLVAQAEHAARTGGDGIVEYLFTDTRRSEPSLIERCDAELALFARPLVTVTYATRDVKTKSGKTVVIDLPYLPIDETLIIQDVTITEVDMIPGLAPRFTVNASSVRFSLEDTLRRLVAAAPSVERV